MSFFQNLFDQEFRQSLPFADRQYSLTFSLPANVNQSQTLIAWNFEPYDLSSGANLTINFAIDCDFKNFASFTVNVAGTTAAETKAYEIVNILNANATFQQWFVATVMSSNNNVGQNTVLIKSIRPKTQVRVYISNGSAESKLRFNKKCGVGELPTYCARHTVANRFTYPDGLACLVQLNVASGTDQQIITEAGLDYTTEQADWELLGGRVGLFNFQKITVDGSNRITEIIEFSAGSIPGMLARKIKYVYSDANTNPDQITEEPYTLTSDDLVTP